MPHSFNELEDKYFLGIKVAGIGLGTVDYLTDTIVLDARAAELFDLPNDVSIPRSDLHARIDPVDWAVVEKHVDDLLNPNTENAMEVTHRVIHRNGETKWLSARKQVTFSVPSDGQSAKPISGLVAIIDISEQKSDQQKVEYLLDELNHRTKNLLSVVQGIARRTFSSGDPESFNERFSNRLQGLARNQDALVKGSWTEADLTELVNSHLAAFINTDNPRVKISGPPVILNSSASQAIGMALHELATNATKYGALANDVGTVTVRWAILPDQEHNLSIAWSEDGGLPIEKPNKSGFGQRVLKDMAALSVNGTVELEFRREGLLWNLRMPVPVSHTSES